MRHGEAAFAPEPEIREEYDVEEAVLKAGLIGIVVPKKGTKVYDRLIEAAKGYIIEVQKMEQSNPSPSSDSENYFTKRKISPSDSGDIRREYHDQLANILINKNRKGLPKEQADKISDFAAYLTGHEEYVNNW